MTRQTLLLPRFLIPVRPSGAVLEGFGILIAGDRIEAIVPENEARRSHPEAKVISLPNHVVLPGLINMHSHSPMTLLRGHADDLDLYHWLNEHIWPAETRHVSAEFVADGTRLAVAEMIRAGTTCFNDVYFFPDQIAKVALEAGIRAVIGLPLLDQTTPWAANFEEFLSKGMAVLEEFHGASLLQFTLAPHAPYSVSDEGLERIASISADMDLKVHMHCLETNFEIQHSLQTYGVRPLERLSRHGLLNQNLIAVHMTQLDGDEIEQLAEQGTHVVHCPQSNLKLASGICPVPALLDAAVNVCLGTDGAASNNNLDMLEEARFAALLAKGASGDATAVNAVQALEMMTINGAVALGLEARIGTIEPGKMADLCAINLASPQTQPVHNVFSQIVYAASSAQFSDVWVAGSRVLREGQLVTLNESLILADADAWRARLADSHRPREAAT